MWFHAIPNIKVTFMREASHKKEDTSIQTMKANESFVHALRMSVPKWTKTAIYLICKAHVWCEKTGNSNRET